MVREHKVPGLFSDQGSGFGQNREPKFELALAIQQSEPGDPRLLGELASRYAGEIFQLATALLDQHSSYPPPRYQICALVEDTFATAVSKSNQFWGESGIEDWLFKITLETYYSQQRWEKLTERFGAQISRGQYWKVPHRPTSTQEEETTVWRQIDALPPDQRSCLILYYLFERRIPDIARLLNKREDRTAGYLYSAWERILASSQAGRGTGEGSHSWMHRKIQDHLTGRLEDDLYAQEELQQHLDQCNACRDMHEEFKQIDMRLPKMLKERWPLLPLTSDEAGKLITAAQTRLQNLQALRELIHPLQKGSWIGLFVLIFVGIAWIVTRSGYLVEEINSIPRPPAPTTYPLPDPVRIPASAQTVDWQAAQRRRPDFIYNAEPSMSEDGRYIAFTHFEAHDNHGGAASLPQIVLYDQITDAYTPITAPLEERGGSQWRFDVVSKEWVESQRPGQDWGHSPSISADGRWIVFTSAEKLEDGERNEYCIRYWGEGYGCPGVYLLDRESRETRRIDRAQNGGPGDNGSFSPRISPDGRMIAFWSSANNLLENDPNPCPQEFDFGDNCIDLFILERETGALNIIPIGRQMEGFMGTSLDLSSRGNLVTLNIQENDRIAGDMEVSNELEAFFYDLRSGQFNALNISQDGLPGNGKSYGAVLSADGRFASFVSHASNLVSGDTNQIADIFVRDLDSGLIERISLSSDGRQGTANVPDQDNRWFSMVNLSGEGHFVTFAFGENDLDGRPLSSCNAVSSGLCTSIYLHDRESGKTHHIASPHTERYLYNPAVSADGRFVSYVENMRKCSSESIQRICGEIWLHDRETGWTSAVSKGIFSPPATQTLLQNPERIPEVSSDLIISPDGQLIATIYNAKNHRSMINLWTVEDRVHKSFLPAEASESITAAAFSPDGQFIAAGLQDGSVDIWRLADQRRGFKLKGQPGKILKVVFSEDSRSITVGSTKAIWVWQLRDRTFYRVAAQNFPLDSISDIAISPQGNHLALAASDGTVWLMSVASGEVTSRLETADGSPLAMAFSPGGDKLAIGSEDGSLQIWEIEFRNGENPDIGYLKTLVHPDQVKQVAFSPKGSTLASTALDGQLRLWNYTAESILDSYPDNAWESVNTFALSLDGRTLASSSWTGPTHLFKNLNQVDQPRFFDRAQSDEVSLPLAFPPDPDSKNWQSPARSLYQANDILETDLKVPTYLPPGFVFGGARVVRMNNAAWLQYYYKEGVDDLPVATLTIFEGPQAAEISDMPLGASARVENIRIALSTNSEIVRGDWIPVGRNSEAASSPHAMATMIWDSQAPSYRQRFQSGSRTISLYYEQIKDASQPHPYINPADLVAIAESLVNLEQTYKPEQALMRYTVNDGDTCTAIAERFGATLGDIVRQNGLTNDCEFIFSGQELMVPLSSDRVTLAENDLNCDGTVERVRVIPNPVSIDGNTVLGIVVETLSKLGYYHEAWQYTLADTAAYLFSYPRIINNGSCQKDLAINLLMNAFGESRDEIYRWQGDSMLPLNEIESANFPH